MKNYSEYFRRYRWLYLVIVFFAGIVTVCGLVKTYFLSIIIDDVIQRENIGLLKKIVVLLLVLTLTEQACSYVIGYLNTHVSQEISYDLRRRILQKINRISVHKMQEQTSSQFVINVTEDVEKISNLLCNYIVTLMNSVFTVVLTIGFILYLNPKLALISFVVITLQIIISCRLSGITKKNQQEILQNNAVHMGLVRQIAGHIKSIRAYRAEHAMMGKYDGVSQKMVALNYKSYLISYIYGSLNGIISFISSIVIFIIGVLAVYNGTLTIGILFVFDSLTGILSGSISNIVNVVIAWVKATVSMNRVDAVFAEPEEDLSGSEPEETITRIAFNDVCFSYQEAPVLEHFSYTFRAGNIYAVIGNSGIGKSTLAGAILKFNLPDSGSISLNDMDLQTVSANAVRSRVAMVFQDSVLLDGCSIRENITLGADVPEDRLEAAVHACFIDEFTDKLEKGLDTLICENGANLSGGEKQRIYVARALLRDCDAYIFDESFSGMDPALTQKMMAYIEQYLSDKIVIVISHDVSSLRKYENIIVFEQNHRITTGNDAALIEHSENYRRFIGRAQ